MVVMVDLILTIGGIAPFIIFTKNLNTERIRHQHSYKYKHLSERNIEVNNS